RFIRLFRQVAAWVAYDPCAIHDVINRLMSMTMNPKRHRLAHQMVEVAGKAWIEAGAFVFGMDTQAVRQVMSDHHGRPDEGLGEPFTEPLCASQMHIPHELRVEAIAVGPFDHSEVSHLTFRIRHRAIQCCWRGSIQGVIGPERGAEEPGPAD